MSEMSDVYGPTRIARAVLAAHAAGTLVAQYGLVERARPAALPALPRARLGVQANYLTDLGVRGMNEAAAFLDEHLRIQRLPDARDTVAAVKADEWVYRWVDECYSEDDLCALIDAQVCFAGAWELARELVTAVLTSARRPDSYGALLYVAVVAGGMADAPVDAGELFTKAIRAAPVPVEAMLTELRHAAYTLKRKGDPAAARTLLAELERHAREHAAQYRISPDDAATLRALAANLDALALLRLGEPEAAFTAVNTAADLIPRDGWVAVDRDAGFRYRCQIKTNVAQMMFKRDDADGALDVLFENLDENRRDHPDSVSETLTIAAYFCYRTGEWRKAVDLVSEAYPLIRREGSPARLLGCRKIAVGALHSWGKTTKTEHVLARSQQDPLGFDEALL